MSSRPLGTTAGTAAQGDDARMTDLVITDVSSATSVNRCMYIADRACKVVAIREVHTAAGSSSTVDIQKTTGAASGGTSVLTAPMSTAGANNTVASGTLVGVDATLTLAAGDCLARVVGGTLTGLANSLVVVTIRFIT